MYLLWCALRNVWLIELFSEAINSASGLVLVGGNDGINRLSSVELFPRSNSSTCSIPDLPEPRQYHTISLLSEGKLVVCGGNSRRRFYFLSCIIFFVSKKRFNSDNSNCKKKIKWRQILRSKNCKLRNACFSIFICGTKSAFSVLTWYYTNEHLLYEQAS